ncbi:hypothetical protein FC25_GL001417 [Ligilactobacillus ruminis DSM 20403 = NBRC 102161]|nr:hypothetical protein FC25_GL001417 [Ligilactobacillus ruminis DSM 20403 = NBRC 102161]
MNFNQRAVSECKFTVSSAFAKCCVCCAQIAMRQLNQPAKMGKTSLFKICS